MKNLDIRKKTKVTEALTFLLQRKWKWAGHVARYNDDRWTIRSFTWSGPR
ncbi:jg18863, partial [Pararge aegeria aegeria]